MAGMLFCLLFEIGVRMKFGDLEDELDEGTRDK